MSLGIVLALGGFFMFSHIKLAQQKSASSGQLCDAPKASGLSPDSRTPLLSPSKV